MFGIPARGLVIMLVTAVVLAFGAASVIVVTQTSQQPVERPLSVYGD